MVVNAFSGVKPELLRDHHVHVVGLRTGGNGAFVNPEMRSWWHPVKRLKFAVYMSASGVKNVESADEEYIMRLLRLVRSIRGHGKYLIMALDKYYHLNGKENPAKTEFYVPNEYVFRLAEKHSEHFIPVVSIHPYRSDAVEELEKWAERGVKFVKWLPNAMGIDPSNGHNRLFYEKMRELHMVLISHTGEEQAVEAEDQRLGNPLLLRNPLNYGVRVVMAHCAGIGKCEDLDSLGKEKVPCSDLFFRMMDEEKYKGLLFGELSAITLTNRHPGVIRKILERTDLHSRLVNGSDYPLPAVNVVINTGTLMRAGFVTQEERESLNEIYDYNPLLYDYALKRTIKHPETNQRLPASIFMAHPALGTWKK